MKAFLELLSNISWQIFKEWKTKYVYIRQKPLWYLNKDTWFVQINLSQSVTENASKYKYVRI